MQMKGLWSPKKRNNAVNDTKLVNGTIIDVRERLRHPQRSRPSANERRQLFAILVRLPDVACAIMYRCLF